jgi:DNA-binding Xre family transcriptional regulator
MHRDTILSKIKVQVDLQFDTREEAAAAIGISGAHLSRIIKGKHKRIHPAVLKWIGYDEHAVYTYSKIKEL